MPQTYETPPCEGGVRGDLLPGASRSLSTVSALRSQILTERFGLSINRADLIAGLAYREAVDA